MNRITDLDALQQFQRDFDTRKDNTVVSVPFTDDYAVVCLVEELGEFARCVKKAKRAKANGQMDEYNKWVGRMKGELTDQFVYLLKTCNEHEINLADAYLEKMEENHKELDAGGGKFLGQDGAEHR